MPKQKNHKKLKKPVPQPQKHPRKTHPFISSRRLALLLISFGLLLIVIPGLFYLNQTIQLALFTPKPSLQAIQQPGAQPTRITISAVKLDLSIEETAIAHNTWGIAQHAVSYLGTSARPGGQGAIILYAHNTNDRFGPIRWLTKGKTIQLTTSKHKTYTYTIIKLIEVPASKVDIFDQKEETLILYTCTGFADLKRFVVIARPLSHL